MPKTEAPETTSRCAKPVCLFSVEIMFILFIRYLQKLRSQQLAKAAQLVAARNATVPITTK